MLENLLEVFQKVGFLKGILETLGMVFFSTLLSYSIGIIVGVLMVITDKNGIAPHSILHKCMGIIINLGRSIPFIILLILLIPLTRMIMGTAIGVRGMILPLTIGAIPFVARLVESSLKEVDDGVIDAAIAMGCNNTQIIFQVYLREAIPSLIRGLSITMIMLVGYSAMSGTVGGGGLGYIAVMNGYYQFDTYTMVVVLVVLVLLVQIIQFCFDGIAKKIDKK